MKWPPKIVQYTEDVRDAVFLDPAYKICVAVWPAVKENRNYEYYL